MLGMLRPARPARWRIAADCRQDIDDPLTHDEPQTWLMGTGEDAAGALDCVEEAGVLKVPTVKLCGTCLVYASLADDHRLQSIKGYTWPGIEYGEAPACRYSFFQVHASCFCGNLLLVLSPVLEVGTETGQGAVRRCGQIWRSSSLSRGGARLCWLVGHPRRQGCWSSPSFRSRCWSGTQQPTAQLDRQTSRYTLSCCGLQLAIVRFLVEARGARVNQQAAKSGWTPLHHCARMAHYAHAPYMQIFQYLLQQGADPSLCTWRPDPQAKRNTQQPSAPMDMAVHKVLPCQADDICTCVKLAHDGSARVRQSSPPPQTCMPQPA